MSEDSLAVYICKKCGVPVISDMQSDHMGSLHHDNTYFSDYFSESPDYYLKVERESTGKRIIFTDEQLESFLEEYYGAILDDTAKQTLYSLLDKIGVKVESD